MKKLIVILVVLGLFSFAAPEQSKASDDAAWFAAGAFAGVVTGAVLADSSCHRGSYYYEEPVYRPVVYRPVVYRPYYGYREYRHHGYRHGYYRDC